MQHVVEEIYSRTIERHVKIQAPTIIGHGTSEDYKREAMAIQSLKAFNDKSVPAGGFGLEKGTLTIPTDWRGIITRISGAAALISIASCILKYIHRSKKPIAKREQEHDNHITVVNNMTPTEVKTVHDSIDSTSGKSVERRPFTMHPPN